jgi:hypothetical protein
VVNNVERHDRSFQEGNDNRDSSVLHHVEACTAVNVKAPCVVWKRYFNLKQPIVRYRREAAMCFYDTSS